MAVLVSFALAALRHYGDKQVGSDAGMVDVFQSLLTSVRAVPESEDAMLLGAMEAALASLNAEHLLHDVAVAKQQIADPLLAAPAPDGQGPMQLEELARRTHFSPEELIEILRHFRKNWEGEGCDL